MPSFAKFIRSRQGQSTVEFALALPIFVMAFFAIVEFSHLFYVKLTVQHALRQAGRYMVTGQGQNAANPSDVNARIVAIQDRFCDKLIGTGLTPCPTLEFTCGDGTCDLNGGGPGETVKVTTPPITKRWFTVLFNQFVPGGVSFTVSTTWVNYGFVTVSS